MNNQEIIQESGIKVLQGVEYRLCLCGLCDEWVHAKDACGRVVKYKPGHNRRGKKKPKDPIVVEVRKIKTLDESNSHLVASGKIMQLKDACIKCMYDCIIKLEGMIKDNSIPYERMHEINEWMQQYEDTIGLTDSPTW